MASEMPPDGAPRDSASPPPKLQMTLLENAYDFLNESLEDADVADEQPLRWKHAILGVVQAIELLLKARLQREHWLLVYSNVDKRTTTVDLGQALDRLQSLGIGVERHYSRAIHQAKKWRDLMTHYEFDLFIHEVKKAYSGLFEFAHFFHLNQLGDELHDHVHEDLWLVEARLMQYFQEQFVKYRGADMVARYPYEIVLAQFDTVVSIEGALYQRLAYGVEPRWQKVDPEYPRPVPCHDCGVLVGEIHVAGCDWEECPRCGGQFLSCECVVDEWSEEEGRWIGQSEADAKTAINDALGSEGEAT
jgi:hypothetical protein